jgi:hypothetical protein
LPWLLNIDAKRLILVRVALSSKPGTFFLISIAVGASSRPRYTSLDYPRVIPSRSCSLKCLGGPRPASPFSCPLPA